MSSAFADLARQLAERAEAVCRHYLSNGERYGRHWVVGNPYNAPGRTMFVRLVARNGDKGLAGKWTDYVARGVMLRPRTGRLFCEGSAASAQHNLSPSGRVA